MSKVSKERVLEALKKVIDPDLNKDIVSLGFVQDLEIDGGTVKFRLVLTTPACPMKDKMKSEAEQYLKEIDGVENVEIELDAQTKTSREPEEALPDVKHVLLVASGKGGVGKSMVAVNVAAALKQTGATVGIMDADIYGPSIPAMLNIHEQPKAASGKMVPPVAYDMPVMSIGFLARDEDALIWRGPILHQVLRQFVNDVTWGCLDYLVVDLPPGTGDVQISLVQLVRASAALLVSTPQDIAFRDVRRAAVMFSKVNVPVIGLVENMSYFVCPHCNEQTKVFPVSDESGLRKIAEGFFVETLAEVPIEPAIAESSEKGTPIVISEPDSKTAAIFKELAGKVAQKLSVLAESPAGGMGGVDGAGPTDQD
jgi:ATP-binding protein involved in chromosome partitioning